MAAQGAVGQSDLLRHVPVADHLRIPRRHHGVVMGTEQINLIIHNTLYVPGTSMPPSSAARPWRSWR